MRILDPTLHQRHRLHVVMTPFTLLFFGFYNTLLGKAPTWGSPSKDKGKRKATISDEDNAATAGRSKRTR